MTTELAGAVRMPPLLRTTLPIPDVPLVKLVRVPEEVTDPVSERPPIVKIGEAFNVALPVRDGATESTIEPEPVVPLVKDVVVPELVIDPVNARLPVVKIGEEFKVELPVRATPSVKETLPVPFISAGLF